MVHFRDVDTIVLVSGIAPGEPQYLQSKPHEGWDPPPKWIVTPVDATVVQVYRGQATATDAMTFVVGGGRVGDFEMVVDRGGAPDLEELADYPEVLLGGRSTTDGGLGQILDPYFAYGVDAGVATSLMETVGGGEVTFTLDELREALRRQ